MSNQNKYHFHRITIEESFSLLGSSVDGWSDEQAGTIREKSGFNELEEKKAKSPWQLFFLQFFDFMIIILLCAALISGIAGDLTDAIIILVIVLLNAFIGFLQEYRAEKAMEALRKMAVVGAKVKRGKDFILIPSRDLVPGDVVLLEAGDAVPADMRIMEAHSVRVDESTLTGESLPVDKISQVLESDTDALGDRINMLYKGTLVTNGRCVALVVATGMKTELGKIAGLLQEAEVETPLKKRMAVFGKNLSYIILLICLIIFIGGWLRGEDLFVMLLLSISLAVAAIPEALPALITVALSRGASRMAKNNALVRRLPAVETLGSVSHICSDKTGTLTLNRMTVAETVSEMATLENGDDPLSLAMALNHDVKISGNSFTGDPTETAIVTGIIANAGREFFDNASLRFLRIAELPFDSDRKCMTTVHQFNNRFLVLTKGASESIAKIIDDSTKVSKLNHLSHSHADKGLRVIAFAYKMMDELPDPFDYKKVESEMQFCGIVGIIDPPRIEVKEAIRECREAGIKPVMITGDHPATAAAVAREIGILTGTEKVISGAEISAMHEDEFEQVVLHTSVFARVSPDQKLRIVRALQSKNYFVAMTGDGVNDAPSLKAADIGVAMGINGTDVSKESADMILLDDNFATIVKAVKEGRRIFDNIRKFVRYIMTCNSAEIWTIFLAPLLGMPMPLLPIHILWINLVTDGLPGIALAGEPAETDVMQRPPRNSGESLFSGGLGFHILWVGLLMAGLTLGIQAWALNNGNTHWQTMVFTVLSVAQLGHALAIRSERTFLYRVGLLSNLPLLGSILLAFALQLMVIYVPFLNDVFRTQPLSLYEVMICVFMAAIVFHAVEAEKVIRRSL